MVGIALEASYIDSLIVAQLNDSDTVLYLVDEGGYVVGSSHEGSNTTAFLGSIQPALFSQLISNSVFIKTVVTGYHKRLCSSTNTTGSEGLGSAGSRLTVSIIIGFIHSLILFFSFLGCRYNFHEYDLALFVFRVDGYFSLCLLLLCLWSGVPC